MTHLEIAAEMNRRWTPFPNLSTMASYSYFSQTLTFNRLAKLDFDRAFREREPAARDRVLPLMAHELQHLKDHFTTLWGRKNLVRICNAFNVRASGRRQEYGEVTALMRDLKTVHFTDYYTEYSPAAADPWDGKPWTYEYSAGVQLGPQGQEQEERPIAFARFSTHDRHYLCRVPMSVSAILEARAVAAEMLAKMNVIGELPEDQRIVETAEWKREMMKNLYEPYLAAYSIAAHYVSNALGISDAVQAYLRAGALGYVCLNMPTKAFENLRIPPSFGPWGARNEAFRRNADRGFLFMAIAEHGRAAAQEPMHQWLEAALQAAGLPAMQEIQCVADEEFAAFRTQIKDGPAHQRLEDVLALGDIYRASMTTGDTGVHLRFDHVPPVLTSDNAFLTFAKGPTGPTYQDPGAWHRESSRLYYLLQEFVDACVL